VISPSDARALSYRTAAQRRLEEIGEHIEKAASDLASPQHCIYEPLNKADDVADAVVTQLRKFGYAVTITWENEALVQARISWKRQWALYRAHTALPIAVWNEAPNRRDLAEALKCATETVELAAVFHLLGGHPVRFGEHSYELMERSQ
jgi:hypothetical protein